MNWWVRFGWWLRDKRTAQAARFGRRHALAGLPMMDGEIWKRPRERVFRLAYRRAYEDGGGASMASGYEIHNSGLPFWPFARYQVWRAGNGWLMEPAFHTYEGWKIACFRTRRAARRQIARDKGDCLDSWPEYKSYPVETMDLEIERKRDA